MLHVSALLALSGFVALSARPALAFERQWRLGAGAGVVSPGSGYQAGPAAALHAVYEVSDVFDLRLELRSSLHESDAEAVSRNTLSQGAVGLVYKLDVIEWVPYLGVRAGYYLFGNDPAPATRAGAMLGTLFGCDYSFSRSAALGAEVSYDTLLADSSAVGVLLHLEYRFGW